MSQAKGGLKHFHHISRGCKIEPRLYNRFTGGRWAKICGGYCLNHKKELCRCGHEWHWHGGSYLFPEIKYNKENRFSVGG